MGDAPQAGGALQSVQTAINIARDGLFLIIIVMLLFLPGKVNHILIEAGFTKASILGFDWEKKLDESAKQTEAAQQEVERLHSELGQYATRIDQVASSVAQPAVKAQTQELARNIRTSQAVAEGVGKRLAINAQTQKNIKALLMSRGQ
jgi:hypothetical protein